MQIKQQHYDCRYIPGRDALDVKAREVKKATAKTLIGEGLYTDAANQLRIKNCFNCYACVPSRIDMNAFVPKRTQRKLLNRHKSLITTIKNPDEVNSPEHAALLWKYMRKRHDEEDFEIYSSQSGWQRVFNVLACTQPSDTKVCELRDEEDTLLAGFIFCEAWDGVSGAACYYDQDSLGTVMILRAIEALREEGWQYLYLGPWTKEASKMTYKSTFNGSGSAFEIRRPNGWEKLDAVPEEQQLGSEELAHTLSDSLLVFDRR